MIFSCSAALVCCAFLAALAKAQVLRGPLDLRQEPVPDDLLKRARAITLNDVIDKIQSTIAESLEEMQQSDVPSDMPSDTPSSAPTASTTTPSQSLLDNDNDGELTTEEILDTSDPTDTTCPIGNFEKFTSPGFSGDFVSYTMSSEVTGDNAGGNDIVFTVTERCAFLINEGNNNTTYNFISPEEWLHHAVTYFGGVERTTNGAYLKLSGLDAPTLMDVKIEALDDFYEVHIIADSPAILGEQPLMWGFPSKSQAEEFEFFLLTIIRSAPDIFLTGETMQCGSGPFCAKVGSDLCYYNPKVNLLEVRRDGDYISYEDSFPWLIDCASSFGCNTDTGGGTFLHFGDPERKVDGAQFIIRGGSVEGNPIVWTCGNESDAQRLFDLVEVVTQDPFYPLTLGGPFQHLIH